MKAQSVRIGLLTWDEVPDKVRACFDNGCGAVRENGMIYTRTGGKILCCEDSEAGEALIRAVTEGCNNTALQEDPWLRLLHGDVSGSPVRDGIPRYVIVFCTAAMQEVPDRALFDDLIPTEPGDAITETGGEIVLIKQTEGLTEEEVTEFAAAVIDTAETEAGIRLQAGIGRLTRRAAELKDSFADAEEAIRLGKRFPSGGSVFTYGHMAAERLMNAVPARERARLRRELFTPETQKLLGSEMMETIDAFFRNDLNLSTTARELFIHRNTLIYRLDKIRKVTGYDLKRFQDAAAFRLLSRLPENEECDG
jgi:hypothetical protein